MQQNHSKMPILSYLGVLKTIIFSTENFVAFELIFSTKIYYIKEFYSNFFIFTENFVAYALKFSVEIIGNFTKKVPPRSDTKCLYYKSGAG